MSKVQKNEKMAIQKYSFLELIIISYCFELKKLQPFFGLDYHFVSVYRSLLKACRNPSWYFTHNLRASGISSGLHISS